MSAATGAGARYWRAASAALLVSAGGLIAAGAVWFGGVRWEGGSGLLLGLAALGLAAAALLSTDAGIALLVVCIPLFDAATLGPASLPFTAAHVLLGATILGWLARVVRHGRAALPRPSLLTLGLGAPLAAALVTLPTSLAPGITAFQAFRLLALWLICMVVAWRAGDPGQARRIVTLLVAVACALAGVAVLQYLGSDIGRSAVDMLRSKTTVPRPAAFFLDPNFLAGYLSVAALAALALAVRALRWRDAGAWVAAALVCGGAMVLTGSRSGMIGFAVGVLVVLITAPRARRLKAVVAVLALTLVAVPLLPVQVTERLAGLLSPQSEGSLATRMLMYESSVEMLGDYWLTGTGLGGFEAAYPPYRRPGALARILHPHQLPLAMWVEMGIPGLFAELVLLAGVVVAWRRSARRGYRSMTAPALAAVAALMVQSLFQYYMFFEYLWLFLAILAASSTSEEESAHA